MEESKKKKTDWGAMSLIFSVIAIVFIVIKWGNVGGFGFPLCNSLGALIAGIVCLCMKEGGNRVLAIIGIVLSIPLLLVSLWWLWQFASIV